jgi:MYXO-CTERM domain-containing protein
LTLVVACSTQSEPAGDRSVARREAARATHAERSALVRPVPEVGALQSYYWVPVTPATNPGMRDSHAMTFDAARGQTVLFSGDVCGSSCVLAPNDTWTFNGSAWTKMAPATSPQARYWSAMTFDSARGVVVLYGGVASSGLDLADTWEWNGTTWTQLFPATNPGARDSFSITYDSARQVTVLFGGEKCSNGACTTFTNLNDTWEWNGSTWAKVTTAAAPAVRLGAGMTYDAARGVTTLFGGTTCSISCNSVTEYADTWTFDGSNWTKLAPATSPTARDSFGFTYDSLRQVSVLFGGFGSSADTWEWNGSAWTPTTPAPSPPYRYWTPMAFDAPHGRAVVFGGTLGTTDQSDTWTYYARGGGCTTQAQCDTGNCVDGVCCMTSSCGTCQACNTATPGTCAPVLNAPDPPSCTGTQTCDDNGQCKLVPGQACPNGNNDCANGACVDGYCCSSACTSACDVCAASLGAPANGTCGPAIKGYSGNPPCAGGYVCNGASDTCPASCSSDADCVNGYYCGATATCQPQKAQGGSCNTAAGADCLQGKCHECATGNCSDGVCCDTACGASCDVCAKALGATADGTCTTAPKGYAGSPTCSPYSCSGGSESCPSGCSGTSDCGPGAFCTGGQCQGTELPGEPCGANGACVSGFCVDGVCCNSACTGQCEACDVSGSEGTCSPVAGTPHGTVRPACPTGSSETPCSAALCDGNTRDACKGYVGSAVTCVQATCTAGVATLASACDGMGNCPAPQTKDCSPYVCSGTTCATQCASDGDCTGGQRCDTGTGTCVSGVTCDGDHTITGANGTTTDCSPYTCTAAGCQTSCHGVVDCVSPSVCDANGTCVLPSAIGADTVTATCSVSTAGAGGDGRGLAGALALVASALVARRWRRAGRRCA